MVGGGHGLREDVSNKDAMNESKNFKGQRLAFTLPIRFLVLSSLGLYVCYNMCVF